MKPKFEREKLDLKLETLNSKRIEKSKSKTKFFEFFV